MKEFRLEATATVALTKWPQMLVWGQPLTPAQASEVIRRTDSLLVTGYGGNDKAFDEEVLRIVGRPNDKDRKDWTVHWAEVAAWQRRWGTIETEYVRNSWLSCAYIHGPYGWCSPDGTIHYSDNIGKWPEADDVFKEWHTLSRKFPFLDLQAVIMSEEMGSEYSEPLVVIDVRDGDAWASSPEWTTPFERFNRTISDVQNYRRRSIEDAALLIALGARYREHALPLDVVREWADSVR